MGVKRGGGGGEGGGTLTCLWGRGWRRAGKPPADKPVGPGRNFWRAWGEAAVLDGAAPASAPKEVRRLGVIWRGRVSLEDPEMGGAGEARELEGPQMTSSEGLCFTDRKALVHSFPALEGSCPVRKKQRVLLWARQEPTWEGEVRASKPARIFRIL